jgi:hypothetical protein
MKANMRGPLPNIYVLYVLRTDKGFPIPQGGKNFIKKDRKEVEKF